MGKLILNNKSYTGSQDLDGLSDVALSSPQNNEVLAYNSTTHKWENKAGGGGATDLNDLTDVDITTPTDGQALVYDSVNSKWINGDAGTLTAEEMTSAQYALLPTPDKLDPNVLHFVNDDTPTELDVSNYYNMKENAMSITADTDTNTLVYAWNGGSNIGAMSVYTIAIPATVKKISFKITTGTSYSTSNDRFKVSVGVKSAYSISSYAAPNDIDWLAVKIFNTNNSVFQDELDLSLITDPTYLYICGHGWNLTVNEVAEIFESNTQKLLYKDFNYTSSGGGGASTLEDLTDVDITTPVGGQSLVYNATSGNWENSTGSMPWIDVIGTLEAGQTSITLTDIHINTNSVIEIFTDSDVDYNSVTVSAGGVTVTFDEQVSNIQVMARITAVNASSIVYNIDLSQYVTNKIWYRSDYQSSSSDTSGINVQGSDSLNNWTSGVTVCIDLDEFTIPASFTKMIIYISTWSATGHSGIFAVSHNTKYEATTSNTSDAILLATRLGYPYIDSNYGTVSETDVVYEISCVPSNFGRYLYIYAGDGLAAEQTSGYNNTYNGTFNATFAGIRFV